MAHLGPLRGSLEAACRHLIWDRHQVEDCLQTAVLEAYARFDRFEEGTNFRAWIFRYLWNVVRNQNRRYDRIRRIEGADLPVDLSGGYDGEGEASFGEILADPVLVLHRVDDRLKKAILALNPPERAVLILRAIGGLSYRETATVLDIPNGSVMGYLHRARTRLRQELAGFAEEMGIAAAGERIA